MRVLCIGDIVSRVGRDMLFKFVDNLKYKSNIDFVIANGENSNHGRGMTRSCYEEMKRAGVDAFTMGNHVWGAKDVSVIMRGEGDVIRPANWPGNPPGAGSVVLSASNGVKIGIINLMGQVEMSPCDNPFAAAERELEKLSKITPVIFVDFHAEATSEKMAMGYFLDGRVSAVFGTHTHIQTADSKILPGGTGYITDLGMTGPADSILGMNKTIIINRFRTGMPQKFEIAVGKGQFCACVFTVDEATGKCTKVERLWFEE
ncbi:MAG: TIGR00282 family metallophosphoesterase [Clostridiales bacterium]|nr:TIGR00282 family metallophosphoesterase [Clostridiales bacterium]